jgi:predicted phage terminase large subunit-like protein
MLPLEIPIAFEPLQQKARYKVFASGRGAAKSHSFARQLIAVSENERCRILCCREVQKSIDQSVHQLLSGIIRKSGRSDLFDITKTKIQCLKTGSEFIFAGLKDLRAADAIRSVEDVKYCWIEEAQNISEESFDILDPTIRVSDSEIWFSLNPRFDTDIAYSMFFDGQPSGIPGTVKTKNVEGAVVRFLSWRDNPFFTDENYRSMCRDKAISDGKYLHKWEGHLQTAAGNMIPRNWWNRYDPGEQRTYLMRFISADTAFSSKTTADYSVMTLWGFDRDHLDLLDMVRGRWEYPQLLAEAKRYLAQHTNQTDFINGVGSMGSMVIEKKASGQSLIQSMRDEGFDVLEYDPGTLDKISRVYAATPAIKFGRVRIPPDDYAPWVPTFLDECSAFRDDMKHAHDDIVDTVTQAEYTWRQTIG